MSSHVSILHRPAFWIALGLVLRLFYLFEQAAFAPSFYTPVLDELETLRSAERLVHGASDDGKALFKAPLYTWFVAGNLLVAGNAWPLLLRLIQHLCGALLVGCAFQSAHLLGKGRPWAGPIAAALLVAYAPLIRLEDRLVLDFFVVFFQSAMIWCLLRAIHAEDRSRLRWLLSASLLVALAWLTRPTILPLVPVLAIVLAWQWPGKALRRRRIAVACLFLFPLVLTVLAFGLRNARVAGEWTFLPWQGGYNFYHANRQGANGRYLVQERFGVSDSANPTESLMVQAWVEAHPGQALHYGDLHRWWMARGWQEFAKDPTGRIQLLLQKAVYLCSGKEIYNFEDFGFALEQSRILPLLPLRAGLLIPLAFAGMAFLVWMERRAACLVLVYAIGLAGLIALFYVSGRMRMPLVFPAALLAGAGLSALRSSGRKVKALALGMGLLGAVLAWGDWWGVRSEDFRHVDYGRLSAAYLEQGQPDAALAALGRCEELQPGYEQLPLMKGLVFHALGRRDEAVKAFQHSARVLTGDPVAPFNLGLILWRQGGGAEGCLRWFDEAARRAPGYMDARWMRARMYTALGQRDQALAALLPGLQQGERNPRFLVSAALFLRADGAEAAATEIEAQLRDRFGDEADGLLEEERALLQFQGWSSSSP